MKIAEADAYRGNAEAAIRGAESAWAEVVASRDAADAHLMQPSLGRIYLIVGRKQEALSVLAKMGNGTCDLGPQQIRHDPFWSRLAGEPRFEEILRSTKQL